MFILTITLSAIFLQFEFNNNCRTRKIFTYSSHLWCVKWNHGPWNRNIERSKEKKKKWHFKLNENSTLENWRDSTAIDRDCMETLVKVGNNEIRSRLRRADVGRSRNNPPRSWTPGCWPADMSSFLEIAITELDSTGKLDENPANQLPCKRVMATWWRAARVT